MMALSRMTAILPAILALNIFASCRGGEDVVVEELRTPVELNVTLTNAMSDSLGLESMDKDIKAFMRKYDIKGMSVSVMKNDSLFFARGYGYADDFTKEEMTPGTLLRVASVSKLVTAAGIMVLSERGLLSLDDKVFGEEGILNDSRITEAIKDNRMYDITVEHLLRHQGGFSTRMGDPMFSTLTMMQVHHLDTPPDNLTLLVNEISRRLKFVPGTSQDYSNFGFMILSLVIEKVTGMSYEDWMQENVLLPAGCTGFHIANNYHEERFPGETRYHMHSGDALVKEYNGSGRDVVRCYGGNDIKALSGAGAWICSTPELSRFVASIDGKPWVPDIISEESVARMTEYFDQNTYSLGWNDTNPEQGWVRTGTLSGTCALIKYYPDGECWTVVTNTGSWMGASFSKYTRGLCNNCRDRYGDLFPSRDLFYETL